MTVTLGYIALVCVGTGVFGVVFLIARNPPTLQAPKLGLRGLKRVQALQGSFRIIEPIVRFLAGGVALLPLHGMRRAAALQLRLAGDFLGLSPDEYIALSVVSALFGAVFGALFSVFVPSPWTIVAWIAVGALLPWSRVNEECKKREKRVNRQLPGAIELAALCMGAGLDFPGALRQLIETAPDRTEPLYEELQNIVQELELGRTREKALLGFAERVPTRTVRDFVSSVVQAERKGTPLAEVLRVQAALQRSARSLRIEENASRAAVAMTLPLLLLLAATLLLVMGPGILKYAGAF